MGRAMNTLPTCSISWETAVGVIRRRPCISPRKALIAQTKKRLGAMDRKLRWASGVPTASAKRRDKRAMISDISAPTAVSSRKEPLTTLRAFRGSFWAR